MEKSAKSQLKYVLYLHVAVEFFQKVKKNSGKIKRIIENDKM